MEQKTRKTYPIVRENPPTALNIVVTLVAVTIYCCALYWASHAQSWLVYLLAVVAFAQVGNTLFSMLHESVHGILSKNYVINEVFGQISSMCFPTGLRFQRTCHLGHHLRNRTDHEIFDMYYPTDNKVMKYLQFYSILSGLYWLSIPFACLLYLLFPWSYKIFESKLIGKTQTDSAMMIPFLNHPAKYRIRFEILLTIAFQVAIYHFLDLHFLPTFVCFWTFGMYWGSLQYADHAWSPRDIREGAWNLKVNPITRWIFLNYHYHQVHHIYPRLPWLHLPKYVDPKQPTPSYLHIYLEMLKGPKPIDAPAPRVIDEALKKDIDENNLRWDTA
jgi:fatty acid desaturase